MAADLKQIQRSLNDRPRKTPDYLRPSEAYAMSLRPPVDSALNPITRTQQDWARHGE